MRASAVLILLLLSILAVHAAQSAEFYVATNGSDGNPGTKSKPFATLERARDVLRLMKRGPGTATVWIRGGVYNRDKTFTLEAGDSGREGAPIVYRACEGETVRITGGREVKDFRPVTDPVVLARLPEEARGHVLQADLKAQGITDYGKLTPRGFGRPATPSHMELFFDDEPMTLAGWPNDGWVSIADVPAGPNGGKFTYDGDRPERWAKSGDVWLHGYWTWPWADSYEKVARIDRSAKEIHTEPPHGVYGYQAHKRWRTLNLLEELDAPGEYYVDRASGVLYFLPPRPIGKGTVVVSIIEEPLISLKDASYITIRGLILEACRGAAVTLKGGSDNLIAGCTLRNIGNSAVIMSGGFRNGVRSCDIYDAGDNGVHLDAGDRVTLTPAGNFVENCRIYRISAWCRTYRPAVALYGVGNRLAHNEIFDLPHSAIIFHGNEHVIEFNDIHGACQETGDAGTIYSGRDFSWRGNVIRYNYIHDVGGYHDAHSGHGFSDTMGIYLDDNLSGTRLYGNVLHNVSRALLIGGGRDNVVQNNVITGCKIGLHLDSRGMGWAKPTVDGFMKDRLEAMPYRESPWKERYPELLDLYESNPGEPRNNVIERNIFLGGAWHVDNNVVDWQKIRDNLVDMDPGFVDYSAGDLRLRDDSPAWNLGFKRIPIESIGPFEDEYRSASVQSAARAKG